MMSGWLFTATLIAILFGGPAAPFMVAPVAFIAEGASQGPEGVTVGMTEAEVRRALGSPSLTRHEDSEPEVRVWVYPRRDLKISFTRGRGGWRVSDIAWPAGMR